MTFVQICYKIHSMKTEIISEREINSIETIKKIGKFLDVDLCFNYDNALQEAIIQICISKLMHVMGLNTKHTNSDFFKFFGMIVGQAIANIQHINIDVACDTLRLVKFKKVNLITEAEKILTTEPIDEAILDCFYLADQFHKVLDILKQENNF